MNELHFLKPTSMKTVHSNLFRHIPVILLLLLGGCAGEPSGFDLSGFPDPPESSKIYTWWHWMDKAISREGITRDLEAMKEQGITGATILNIGLFDGRDFGVPQVPFGSPA